MKISSVFAFSLETFSAKISKLLNREALKDGMIQVSQDVLQSTLTPGRNHVYFS